MNRLSIKTLKLLLLTAIILFLGLLILVIYLYQKEEMKISNIPIQSQIWDGHTDDMVKVSKNQSLQRENYEEVELSTELKPKKEALRRDATLDQERVNSINDPIIKRPDITNREFHSTFGRKVVFIYFSHTRESFLPYFKNGTTPESAYHSQVNVSLVGKRLGNSLRYNGIWNKVSNIDIINMLDERNLNFGSSYQMSREVVMQEKRKNSELEMAFDIHRDSLPRELSTTNINGKSMAKISFVIGSSHDNYRENLAFASRIHDLIEKSYPGLSRGIIIKDKSQGNGVYNQDLLPNNVIVEIGGVENNLEELYRSADILGEAISEYYWEMVHE